MPREFRSKTKQDRFFITNEHLTPAVKNFEVIQDANFPTHRQIRIKIATTELTTTTNQLRKPTNYAKMFQDKLDEEAQKVLDVREPSQATITAAITAAMS